MVDEREFILILVECVLFDIILFSFIINVFEVEFVYEVCIFDVSEIIIVVVVDVLW